MCKLLEEMRKEVAACAEAKGRAEGKAEGKTEKTMELASKMLARGRDSVEEIAEMTGLSLEEVRELSKKNIA